MAAAELKVLRPPVDAGGAPGGELPGSVKLPGEDGYLLATKLAVPRPVADLVPRERLVAALEEGRRAGRRLTLVAAPAGWGKTTLVAAFAGTAARAGAGVGWVSLDPEDDDPRRFWRYVVAALDRLRSGDGPGNRLADSVLPALQAPDLPPEVALTALVNAVAAWPRPALLVLDDYHAVGGEELHRGVAFLLAHLPPTLHLVLAGRADPPLPLARLRAGGHLTEVRADDLRFTTEEAAAFLRAVGRPDLAPGDAATLTERTEGWVAGLRLAALSLRQHEDPGAVAAAFGGGQRAVLDYLAEEVLAGLPAADRAFLLRTSMVERLCASVAEAVTGEADAQATLERLERANLFLVPLDDERRCYRYHRLFADALRARLRRDEPDLVPELHRRAADWHRANGMVLEAIELLLAAPDHAAAADLIEAEAGRVVWVCGVLGNVRGWLDRLPAALVTARPRLALTHAWALALTGRTEDAAARVDDAERALGSAPDGEGAALRGEAAAVRARLAAMRGDPAAVIAHAERALALLPPGDAAVRGEVALNLGSAHRAGGDLAAAGRAFAEAQRAGRAGGSGRLAMLATKYLGDLELARGRLHAAEAVYRDGLAAHADWGFAGQPAVGMLHVGVAEVLTEQNELDAAEPEAERALALGWRGGDVKVLLPAHEARTRLRRARGDLAGADGAAAAAERLYPTSYLAALRARLALARGDRAAARRWARDAAPDPDGPPEDLGASFEGATLVRFFLAEGEPDRAAALAGRLLAAAERAGWTGAAIEALALLALAEAARGDRAAGGAALRRALALAEPEGYVRLFADEGAPMAALLAEVAGDAGGPGDGDRPVGRAYLDRVLGAVAGTPAQRVPTQRVPAPAARPGAALPELLTERELEVLRLAHEGLSNGEIADRLFVTVGTVKTHAHRAYGKLGARSRTQALARARELGLLDPAGPS